jgi:hypothetical protein
MILPIGTGRELATAEITIRSVPPFVVPEIIFVTALTEIRGSAISHRAAVRARPCTFFHENHRFLSRHGHGGACAFGESICPGVMQPGDAVCSPPHEHTHAGRIRHQAPRAQPDFAFPNWHYFAAPSCVIGE